MNVCVNCGQPATWKTTSTGSPTDYFCDACADTAYPTHAELEALEQPSEPEPANESELQPGEPVPRATARRRPPPPPVIADGE